MSAPQPPTALVDQIPTETSAEVSESAGAVPLYQHIRVGCRTHFPLNEFNWDDGEPMEPSLQEAWHIEHTAKLEKAKEERRQRRIIDLRRELAELEGAALMTGTEE